MSKLHVQILIVALLGFVTNGMTRGATVVWPGAGINSWGDGSMHYDIGSDVHVSGGDGWRYWIETEIVNVTEWGATLQAFSGTIGAGHTWYETAHGYVVDATTVAEADYFVNIYTLEFDSLEMLTNEVFYLGFRLEYDVRVGTFAYGWAALRWDGSELSMVDSAAETTGVGIYAGTHTPVPEPATGALALAGLVPLVLRRWHKRRATA